MADNSDEITVKDRFKFCCSIHWRGIVIFITPLVFLPLLFLKPILAMRCAYVLGVMATYWILEVIPIYVTALIPIVAWPALGVLSSNETAMQYMKDVVLFFLASMVVAIAVEYRQLHTRIALAVIDSVGCSPRSLMIVTWFVSFWISNSATTAMMSPIAKAILMQLDEQGLIKFNQDRPVSEDEPPYPSKVTIAYFVGIAYSACIGGCATLIGTGTNLAIKGLYDDRFPKSTDMSFSAFTYFNLPPVIIIFIITYLWLEVLYMGMFRPNSAIAKELVVTEDGKKAASALIKQRRADLGKISSAEIFIAIYFALMVALLFLRKPDIFPGYAKLFPEKEIKTSSPTVFVALLMFLTPAAWLFCRYFICRKPENDKPGEALMDWDFIQKKMPWGILLLLGGGFALSKGIQSSKLAVLIGDNLRMLEHYPKEFISIVAIIAGLVFTAFAANVAIANICMPILFEIAVVAKVHPLYLAFPAGMVMSLAFFLPVSTPPNAIVAGLVNIRTKDMALAATIPTLGALIVYFFAAQFYAPLIFENYNTFPEWAQE